MPIAVMTAPMPTTEPGAPVAKSAIDPDLIKLSRGRPKIGAVTAAAIVILCGYFILRLSPDRKFAAAGEAQHVTVAEVAAGKVAPESFVELEGEPLMANAIRASKAKTGLGLRLTPFRGSGDRVWVALGDGDDTPTLGNYHGRIRPLTTMPFEDAVRAYAVANPRPVFATPAAIAAGSATNAVKTVDGGDVTLADGDRIAYDLLAPDAAALYVTLTDKTLDHGPLLDVAQWQAHLASIGIPATPSPGTEQLARRDAVLRQARLDVAMPVAAVTQKLETAKLWARIEPVVRHHETTWRELKASMATTPGPTGAAPLAGVDLVGLYVMRGIPADARVLLVGEQPKDYWHVMPLTVVLALIGLLFAWALVRAFKELAPVRT